MAKKNDGDDKVTTRMRVGSFGLGVVFLGAAVADALLNPFAFITADKLLLTAGGLITVGVTGRTGGKDGK